MFFCRRDVHSGDDNMCPLGMPISRKNAPLFLVTEVFCPWLEKCGIGKFYPLFREILPPVSGNFTPLRSCEPLKNKG